MSPEAPLSLPPLFEFRSADFPALIDFMRKSIEANAVPLEANTSTGRFPEPPARILELAQNLHDNGAMGTVSVQCHQGDGPALEAWSARIAELLNWDPGIHVQLENSQGFQTEFDGARAFITRLDHALRDEREALGDRSCSITSFFSVDSGLLDATGVWGELLKYVQARCKALGCNGTIEKNSSQQGINLCVWALGCPFSPLADRSREP